MTGIEKAQEIMEEVKKVVFGKDEVIKQIMTCFLAGGNVLVDDIPGVGKTTLALAFARAMGMEEQRIQFTPDVMPSDVLGFTTYDMEKKEFVYKKGAVFCNLLLADEINRTSSKTQSALLEAMEEKSVTVEGKTYPLGNPFLVIATQNPTGSVGTNMLPESQLDRFMIRTSMGYPLKEYEIQMLLGKQNDMDHNHVTKVSSVEEFLSMQDEVKEVYVHPRILDYIVSLVQATRNRETIRLGVSPRGTIACMQMSKAYAYLEGRDYVVPGDVKNILLPTIGHRILLSRGHTSEDIKKELDDILDQVGVPAKESL